MSPREIVHRLSEQAKRQALRRQAARWDAFDATPGALKTLPAFFAMLHAKRSLAFEGLLQSVVADTLGGGFSALGVEWPKRTAWRDSAWFLDPVTGKSWPGAETFCFDIEYRHNPDFGDVKYVWEANRLQFLQPVAMLALSDPKLARFAIDTVLAWMDANPPFTGVNWNSGIELALRLVSLAIVVAAVGDALTPEERGRFAQFVTAHAHWLERFPSLYSSANNHRVAEGLGLTVAALLMPEAPSSARYLKEGSAILRASAGNQFHDDGVGVEQSPTYAAFTLEMLCVGALVLRDTPYPFDGDELGKLGSAAVALDAMLDANGFAPRIGDDDEGRVVGSSNIEEPRYVASVVSLAGIVSGLGDLAVGVCDPSLRDGLAEKLGDDSSARELYDAQKDWDVMWRWSGGYTLIRDCIGMSRFALVFDHGPLGFGSIAAHGHADALSVWLGVEGKPVLVDAGTYLYHSGGAWREFFRSTAAHNTLEVAGLSQSVTSGAFNWRHKARAKATRYATGSPWRIEASHDGYRARLGVDHVRRLERTETGFCIEDRLVGAKTLLPVAIRFLVHPDLAVQAEGDALSIRDGARRLVSIEGPHGMKGLIVRGQGDSAGPGWYSPSFGKRMATACIVFEGTMKEGDVAVTQLRIGG
jgi:uncharacterized heparinase superfamily protein